MTAAGELGRGVTGPPAGGFDSTTASPGTVFPQATVVALSAGAYFTCLLLNTSGVRCWGNNDHAQLGTNDTVMLTSVPSSDVMTGVSAVSAGSYFTCVLRSETGGVKCWGANDVGQSGAHA